jgi:hypothetical protein
MDHNVMMEPAEGGQIIGISRSTLRPGNDVVWLKPVSAGTSVCGAVGVAMHDESLQLLGNYL